MNHYETLGVAPNATAVEIKAAFRKLASQHHPDRGGDKEKSAAVNDAYAVLSDSERRARYDAGQADVAPPSPEQLLRIKALQVLDAVFNAVLADPNCEAAGFMRQVRAKLSEAGRHGASQQIEARSQAKRLERIKGKLLRSKEGEDIATSILERKIADHLRRAAQLDDDLAQVNAATAMLAEYGDETSMPRPLSQYEALQAQARIFGAGVWP